MTNSYKQNLKKGKLRRNLVSYLSAEDQLYGEIEDVDLLLNKKFEKIKKRNPQRGQ